MRRGEICLLCLLAAAADAALPNLGARVRYYMYEEPALNFSHLLACPGAAALLESAHGEGLQEVHVYHRLLTHPQRVRNASLANAFYLPLMEYLSWKMQQCHGQSHEERVFEAYTALRRQPWFAKYRGQDHFWVSSKSHAFGPDLVGTPYANVTVSISMKKRLRPLSKALRRSTVGRMKPFGRLRPKSPSSSVGKCTFDVGHQPNQECLRVFEKIDRSQPRKRLIYFAGSFDVCCTGKMIRCRLAGLVPLTDGDADTLLVPSRGARGSGRECTEKALVKVAQKRGVDVETVAASYSHIADGPTKNRYLTMAHYMSETVFCLAPAGDICTSSRFYSSIAAGCIPVVLCDGLKAAFFDFVNYNDFLFRYDTTLFMEDPMGLMRALRAVNASEVLRMQRALVR
ncbi:exostosin family-domain-containing protein [Pavlovales sp. CCMP2436]|nr:exostosin family-domain-containing protein [Pavlovales sp. CCMP2436]